MCPYIEKGDGRCQRNLNLAHIEQAVGLCASRYKACPVYAYLKASDCKACRERPALNPLKA